MWGKFNMYTIIWRYSHREPFVDVDSRGFTQTFPTYEMAKAEAENVMKIENENEPSPWYFDYKILKETDL